MSELFRTELFQAAKANGYHRFSTILCRTVEDMALLINPQKSRWGDGLYINMGLLPVGMFKQNGRPRNSGSWPLEERASSCSGALQPKFTLLESSDQHLASSPQDRRAMIAWIFTWMEQHFGNLQRLRQMILGSDPDDVLRPYVALSHEPWMLRDWAMARLKGPEHYYKSIESS